MNSIPGALTLLMARSHSIFSAQVLVEKWWSPRLKQLQSMPTRSLTPRTVQADAQRHEKNMPRLTSSWHPQSVCVCVNFVGP